MNKSTELLNNLIEITRDGQQFYLDAARNALDPDLRDTFQGQAELRKRLINDLSESVEDCGGDPSPGVTMAGRTRKLYSAIVSALSRNRQGVYLEQLDEVEDRLLGQFRRARDEVEIEKMRRVLTGYQPIVESANEEMKALGRNRRAA